MNCLSLFELPGSIIYAYRESLSGFNVLKFLGGKEEMSYSGGGSLIL